MQSLKVTIPWTDETAMPLNPEWHSEILVEDVVSIPDEIKVQFVIGEFINHFLTPWYDVWKVNHALLTPWYDTSLYLALIYCVVIISHIVWCILRWIKDKYKLHYIYLFTLEIHCIIRVKHVLTHHSSTANYICRTHIPLLGCCCTDAAHTNTNALIALPSNLLIPRMVSPTTNTIYNIN